MVSAGIAGTSSADASSRSSPAAGVTAAKDSAAAKRKLVNSNGYHPTKSQAPLSSMLSAPLDLTSVERRGQPTAAREPSKKKSRPHGILEAPTYCPTEDEWRDPLEYIKKIGPAASEYGICKIIPPESWNPDFAIDTEKFHFRTRKQELNSVEGSTRANLTYLDGLSKFHRQQGQNLHRLPYVDKKPLDLYRLKKAVESRGGFDKVCKLKKWAEIGRDLGYSGKIMSSLSTSLKNSYQRWLCPYEEYLRLAKPGVHQQLEVEYGGPLTPSPAVTPARRLNANGSPKDASSSQTRHASEALQSSISNTNNEAERDTPMKDALPVPRDGSAPGFSAVNSGGFKAVNSAFTSVNRPVKAESRKWTPESRLVDSPEGSIKDHTESPSLAAAAAALKRRPSREASADASQKKMDSEKEETDGSRRSKRLKKENIPTVAGSHMTLFRPSLPKIPREENDAPTEKCETCGRDDESGLLLICESCDHAYHGPCLDPPLKKKPEAEWNCPRCLVGDGQFGFEEGGLYSLKQFQQKANDFKQGYFEKKMPFDHTLNCHRPVTEDDVETEFWRLVADLEETVEVEYGADIHCTTHGSGFPTLEKHPNNPYSADPWNLNILPFHPDSLFRHIKSDISGMTVPWVYVGMIFSTFCWHNEDHYAYSANYQHLGATKTWYGIPGEDAEKFEAAMQEAVPELFETQPDLLFQLVTLLTPEQLKKAGVRVYAVDQRAGQFVITFPQAYHAGFNHGFNFNEAVNFAPPDWESFGQAGVERLARFRRQPCFSHDELLCTAAEGYSSAGLTIQTSKWLAPALGRMRKREIAMRKDFMAQHVEASPHQCRVFKEGADPTCPLTFGFDDDDVQDEEQQCCSYCKSFAYMSRFKCEHSGKVLCLFHAGYIPCCEQDERQRWMGDGHTLIYRKSDGAIEAMHEKVLEKANAPDAWEAKYEQLLEEEGLPSLKLLRTLLHEGERIPYPLPSLPLLREFVERCNAWVEEATNYIVRKQQNRRKNDRIWQNGSRKSTSNFFSDQKERDSRNVSNVSRLLKEAERIGFDCPEILQLRERAEAIAEFQSRAAHALEMSATTTIEAIEELLEEGRGFNVDTPEEDQLMSVLDHKRWNERAQASRGVCLSAQEVQDLVEDGMRVGIPQLNEHFVHFVKQLNAGKAWEEKAKELMNVPFVHYPQLEALWNQVTANALPVSAEILAEVDQILHKAQEAYRLVTLLTDRCRETDFRKRPRYDEVVQVLKSYEAFNKPKGSLDLENEKKRHEDWIRKGKRLFGKSNAPLHILNIHLAYVFERNRDCFDTERDTPRRPGEPASRENTPEDSGPGEQQGQIRHANQEVFCICRKVEAGMMIECELCHEWYHYKCLKLARGKVKEDDKFTCPICDWRVKIPRDAARPKLEDLIALADEMPSLPFQPEEEELLARVIDNAQNFRKRIDRFCKPLLSTEAEIETQRFYLRKLEGAEVLLAYETNFFRQELHKWCPVAPEPPPILEVSLSTRKPRPTKLQKMLVEYGVDNPDDLPEHAKGKANSLRRKAANAEAAQAAALAQSTSNLVLDALFPRALQASNGAPLDIISAPRDEFGPEDYDSYPSDVSVGTSFAEVDGASPPVAEDASQDGEHGNNGSTDKGKAKVVERKSQYAFAATPADVSPSVGGAQSQDHQIDLNSRTENGKGNAFEISDRTNSVKKEVDKVRGSDATATTRGSGSERDHSMVKAEMSSVIREDEGYVDSLPKEKPNYDHEIVQSEKSGAAERPHDLGKTS